MAAADRAREVVEQRLVLVAERRVVGGEMGAGIDTHAAGRFRHERIVLAREVFDLRLQALVGGAQLGDAVELVALDVAGAAREGDAGDAEGESGGSQGMRGYWVLLRWRDATRGNVGGAMEGQRRVLVPALMRFSDQRRMKRTEPS